MHTIKVNYTIPEELDKKLRQLIKSRERSSFVTKAITEKLNQLEKEKLRKQLREGYKAREYEDMKITEEWELATLEEGDD
jgi:metal-responsive CopG/Arc/MetJ family transcriptional regulator